jgi:hypothetical protein
MHDATLTRFSVAILCLRNLEQDALSDWAMSGRSWFNLILFVFLRLRNAKFEVEEVAPKNTICRDVHTVV